MSAATFDFEKARFNMIEQQIRPWEVLDATVLSLLGQIKREAFVPPAYQALAELDPDAMSPRDALDALYRLRAQLDRPAGA